MSLGQRLDRLERAVGLNAPCPVCHGTGCTLADSCIVTAEGDEAPPPPSCSHCGRSPKPGFTINHRPPPPTPGHQSHGHTESNFLFLSVDDSGTIWRVTEAPLTRADDVQQLKRLPAHRAFWFGLYADFPETRLVQ